MDIVTESMILVGKSQLKIAEESLLLLAAFAVPFVNIAPVPSVVMSVMCMCLYIYDFCKGKSPILNFAAIALLLFYIYSIISSISFGLAPLFGRITTQIRLPIVLFSLAFLFSNGEINVKRLLHWFTMGAFACATICVIVYLYSLCTAFNGVPYSALNAKLCFESVLALITHRTYIGFNMLVGLIVLFQDTIVQPAKPLIKRFVGLALFSGAFIFLSGARIVLLSYCLMLIMFLMVYLSKRISWAKLLCSATIISLGCLGLLMMNSRLHDLVFSIWRGDADWLSLDPRFSIWHCAKLVMEHHDIPFMGIGTGMSFELMKQEYEAIGFHTGIVAQLNMHNQFIETYVEYGIIGMILFAFVLAALFRSKTNHLFFRLYALLLIVNLCFESMLCRSMGAYSIAFIIALSGLHSDREQQPLQMPNIVNKSLYALLIASTMALSLKFILKDKREAFASFQRYFEQVEALPGVVPSALHGEIGMRANCHTSSEVWVNKATTYHRFAQYGINEADSVDFSLYVYVSDDFDGTDVEIKLEERGIFTYADKYNMEQRGTWQQLHVGRNGMYGNVFCTFAFAKEGSLDFKELKGFVIFAKPKTECFKQ